MKLGLPVGHHVRRVLELVPAALNDNRLESSHSVIFADQCTKHDEVCLVVNDKQVYGDAPFQFLVARVHIINKLQDIAPLFKSQ